MAEEISIIMQTGAAKGLAQGKALGGGGEGGVKGALLKEHTHTSVCKHARIPFRKTYIYSM